MQIGLIPPDEEERLKALYSYNILDTPPEDIFDDITWIASKICNTSLSVITLIDRDRQWFKSIEGNGITEKSTSRDVAFCAHTINQNDMLQVPDAAEDERFHDNPLVTGNPKIRFYAGVPLATPGKFKLGSLCVIDYEPKKLTDLQADILQRLSRIVVTLLEERKNNAVLIALNKNLQNQKTQR